MGFRERPEYQEWRDSVTRLLGRKCIRCGHSGNIHVHHVRPVNTYPELAFDPSNGVPLCGNCHAEIAGNELAYVEELESLQRQALGATAPGDDRQPRDEDELKRKALENPSDAGTVELWFKRGTDAREIVAFYEKYHGSFRKTPALYAHLAFHLGKLERWRDVIKVADGIIACAQREGTLDKWIRNASLVRYSALVALGRESEGIQVLREAVSQFPSEGYLHKLLSSALLLQVQYKNASEECLEHARTAASLCPNDFDIVQHAARAMIPAEDFSSALRFAKRAADLARSDEERIESLHTLGDVYSRSELYDEAIKHCRRILEIDDANCDAMAEIAHCLYMTDRMADAYRMAKKCLLHDPENKNCQWLVEHCTKT
jgi:tetratricopeptide (TPR) repeat protein